MKVDMSHIIFNFFLLCCSIPFTQSKQIDDNSSGKYPPIRQRLPASVTESNVFPSTFNFGVSTSSYQVEGGWLEGNKGLSIWDAYSHIPGRIANNDTGDIANDMYHLYKSDIEIMQQHNIRHYRFSIAWNRIMPTGLFQFPPPFFSA
jgi:hypothetical protein